MPYSNGSLRNPQTSPKAKKKLFCFRKSAGAKFSSLYRPHSQMCIRIYIFCFKQKNTHTHTHTETKSKRNKRNQPRKGERKYVCC